MNASGRRGQVVKLQYRDQRKPRDANCQKTETAKDRNLRGLRTFSQVPQPSKKIHVRLGVGPSRFTYCKDGDLELLKIYDELKGPYISMLPYKTGCFATPSEIRYARDFVPRLNSFHSTLKCV